MRKFIDLPLPRTTAVAHVYSKPPVSEKELYYFDHLMQGNSREFKQKASAINNQFER